MIKKLILTMVISGILAYFSELASYKRYKSNDSNGAKEGILIDPRIDPLSDEMVNAINSLNTTWKAKRNFIGVSYDYVLRLCGTIPDEDHLPEEGYTPIDDSIEIPESFDAREAWPNCPSISHIRDQGNCGSCWAMAAVDVMSDRFCIHSGGAIQVELSTQDVLACAEGSEGCEPGATRKAWKFWVDHGIVTGGDYNEKVGCRPYEYAPCIHNSSSPSYNCTNKVEEHPVCKKECEPWYEEKTNKTYETDKYHGTGFYHIDVTSANLTKPIQIEIMKNGSVAATFDVTNGFFSYASGVYKAHSQRTGKAHSVRIIGWGVEDGVDYWLVANSWGTDWGDKGFFKFIRGNDTAGIESKVFAGMPKLTQK